MPENTSTFSTIRTPSSYPTSRKRYLQGSRADVHVPYREITLSDTRHGDHAEANIPLPVYDTSGPYTDPEIGIRLTRGLNALRRNWIKEREDTETLTGHSSEYARGLETNLLKFHLRFPSPFSALRARRGKSVSQMHYVRKGIITPEMEFVALPLPIFYCAIAAMKLGLGFRTFSGISSSSTIATSVTIPSRTRAKVIA